ncbi:MAG: glycosyltransferase family A protein [Opitutaceae bacterium]|jgi:glycosyltransferase involved in cell wall biosynthesis
MNSPPDLSVVIPVFNRGKLVRHTLDSVRAASAGLSVETVLVDDGSEVPLADDLALLGLHADRLIRQENQGLLFARLAGLKYATGRSVLFLDSDDLVSRDKLRAHIEAHAAGADVAYSDTARQHLPADGPVGEPTHDLTLPETNDPADFFIKVQPAPHSPSFATEWLRTRVANALFAPSHLYNPVAEIWFYHICAPFAGRVVKCAGRAIIGEHAGGRLTNHWERLAVASLAVQEGFMRTCPKSVEGLRAGEYFSAKAFGSWRRLPRGFSEEFCRRQLALYLLNPCKPSVASLGGGIFGAAARVLGVVTAGRLFRLRNGSYESCRTVDDETFSSLMNALPPP